MSLDEIANNISSFYLSIHTQQMQQRQTKLFYCEKKSVNYAYFNSMYNPYQLHKIKLNSCP